MIIADLGTCLNEARLSKDQAKVLDTMVESLSEWHITLKGQEKKTIDGINKVAKKMPALY